MQTTAPANPPLLQGLHGRRLLRAAARARVPLQEAPSGLQGGRLRGARFILVLISGGIGIAALWCLLITLVPLLPSCLPARLLALLLPLLAAAGHAACRVIALCRLLLAAVAAAAVAAARCRPPLPHKAAQLQGRQAGQAVARRHMHAAAPAAKQVAATAGGPEVNGQPLQPWQALQHNVRALLRRQAQGCELGDLGQALARGQAVDGQLRQLRGRGGGGRPVGTHARVHAVHGEPAMHSAHSIWLHTLLAMSAGQPARSPGKGSKRRVRGRGRAWASTERADRSPCRLRGGASSSSSNRTARALSPAAGGWDSTVKGQAACDKVGRGGGEGGQRGGAGRYRRSAAAGCGAAGRSPSALLRALHCPHALLTPCSRAHP